MEEFSHTESAHQQKSPLKGDVRSQGHRDIVTLERVYPQFNGYPRPETEIYEHA